MRHPFCPRPHRDRRRPARARLRAGALASGEEAIAALDARDDIRLIVTDVVMPGMTGPELIAAIAPRHGDVPVLYVTGYVGEAGDAAGFAGHEVLRKPFTVAALERAVTAAMAGRRTAPARPLAANE